MVVKIVDLATNEAFTDFTYKLTFINTRKFKVDITTKQ